MLAEYYVILVVKFELIYYNGGNMKNNKNNCKLFDETTAQQVADKIEYIWHI